MSFDKPYSAVSSYRNSSGHGPKAFPLLIIMLLVSGILVWKGLPILVALLFGCLILVLFLIRIDIAFSITVVLYMTLAAIPLSITSPFRPGETADLPLYEVLLPILGLFLLVRMAMEKEAPASSPLRIPILVWLGYVGITYARNPVFLADLFGAKGTGAIYHSVYPIFLCAIVYFSAASVMKSDRRLILTAKVVFWVMVVGMATMTFMLVTGWDIPFLTGGRSPWAVTVRVYEGGTVYRILAMGAYSSMLFLALLCFGSTWHKPFQLLIALLLIVAMVVAGGRTPVIMICVFFSLSFVLQPKRRWLIGWTGFVLIITSLFILPNIRLPYTTRRIVTVSADQQIGVGGRLSMAQVSWRAIKKRPLIGYGYGQLWKYFPQSLVSKQVASGDPHAGVLAVATSGGLIGLSLFLWLLLTAIKIGWKLYREVGNPVVRQLMLWMTFHLIALFITFFISAQTEKNIFAYLEMGMIAATYAVHDRKQKAISS